MKKQSSTLNTQNRRLGRKRTDPGRASQPDACKSDSVIKRRKQAICQRRSDAAEPQGAGSPRRCQSVSQGLSCFPALIRGFLWKTCSTGESAICSSLGWQATL